MSKEEWLICRDCDEEFDANDSLHSSKGFRNQCFDCAEEAGLDNDTVMGAIQYNEDGDIMGVDIVDKKTFEKINDIDKATKGILGGR